MNVIRTIMHIDMNAFFASVEQRANPSLRGKAIAVVGSGGRTVVTTSSYEARARGVRTGMNKYEAKKLCPELIVVVGDNRKYVDTSTRIISIFEEFSSLVEVFSIDEAFVDITGSISLFGSAKEIARLIKERIMAECGITCSIGIAPNKLMAKLASGMEKPDGLVVIEAKDIERTLEDMPATELCGIGSKLGGKLAMMGIATCGELKRSPASMLRQRFGITGERLVFMARGIDDSPVLSTKASKDNKVGSIGHSTTLPRDIADTEEIRRYIVSLSEMVARRARRHAFKGATVTLTIRYADFHTISRQRSFKEPTSCGKDISSIATSIFLGLGTGGGGRAGAVRLVGISISKLTAEAGQQKLFNKDRKRDALLSAVDSIKDRFGDRALTRAVLTGKDEKTRVISPSWKPVGVKKVDVE